MTSENTDLCDGDGDGNGNSAAPETPKPKPSDKQMNLLAIMMQNTEEQPKVNWENVAAEAGLKNERVAKETYRQMCKKFGWNKAGGPFTPGSAKVTKPTTGKVGTPRKPRGKKAAAPAAAVDNNGDDEAAGVTDPFMSGTV